MVLLPGFACGGKVHESPPPESGEHQAGDANTLATGGTIAVGGASAIAVGGAVSSVGGFVTGGTLSMGGTVWTGGVSTGGKMVALPADKALGALTADEVEQFRGEIVSLIDERMAAVPLDVRCHYLGVVQASLIAGAGASGTSDDVRESCALSEADCVAGKRSVYIEPRLLHPTNTENEDGFRECSATVGDYRTCTADLVQAKADVMVALPACSALDVKYYHGVLGDVPVKPTEPSSCSSLYSECWRILAHRPE
ncbi:MAG TPA: hypothetical protein VFQ61_09245 [Polyangiaceae bacterium]|nr:hypothetical protein [Polyangiaceae bacterium]